MKKHIFIILLFFSAIGYSQSVRFVSKSGNSTPPYTSWTTACDSIRPVIDICNPGDTIFIDSGIYRDTLDINIPLTIIGKGIGSTILDAIDSRLYAINVNANCNFQKIRFIGNTLQLYGGSKIIHFNTDDTLKVESCSFELATSHISNFHGSMEIKNSIFNLYLGTTGIISGSSTTDTEDLIENCQFTSIEDGTGIRIAGEKITIRNCFFKGLSKAILHSFYSKTMIIENNIFPAKRASLDIHIVSDSLIVRNNLFHHHKDPEFRAGLIREVNVGRIYNNIFFNNSKGYSIEVYQDYYADYNAFYGNEQDLLINATYGDHDVFLEPMFEGEFDGTTPPDELLAYLQKFSPLVDAGAPFEKDIDGTISDIGPYGGQYGEIYEYKDLPPKKPSRPNFAGINHDPLKILWTPNTENDLAGYKIHMDSESNFTPSVSNFIMLTDTNFAEIGTVLSETIYIKTVAVDNQGNESTPSDAMQVIVTAQRENDNIEFEDKLFNNYPNPFNPETKIRFSLKEESLVTIKIFDIRGELIKKESEKLYPAGGHEVSLNLSNFASGIYIVTLQVEQGGKPIFTDSKKITLLK
ncbi:MAG: hypothetical protein SCALA702_00230 [Melioribacteraceae bacterium]|nr:MAG: hypothetical protein SCALA702_00230 [Melioribacteraceae bacterium]